MTMSLSRYCMWLAIVAVIVGLDLWTKSLASAHLVLYRPEPVTSWFNLTLAHNSGAAFSFLASAGGWQRWFFSAAAVLISAVLLVWLARQPTPARLLPTALVLVLGGAIGNLIDRLRFGYVVDFIDLHAAGWHWPAFNLADAAIVLGVILLLIDGFVPRGQALVRD